MTVQCRVPASPWMIRLSALGVAVASMGAMAAAQAADRAWTRDQVSQGLQALDRAVTVQYVPVPRDAAAVSGRITQVYASRDYAGTARVATRLCWGSVQGPCVALQGRSIQTHALDGRPAAGPVLLVHQVIGWGADHPPLFVRGTVTVWFDGK